MRNSVEYEYRGYKFRKTKKRYWVFNVQLPNMEYCSRYFTKEELDNLNVQAMKNAIDRMIERNPVYLGDIRFR